MTKYPLPLNEEERLLELYAHDLLHSGYDESFDDITELAKELCGAEGALVTVIDRDKLWVKSPQGTTIKEVPREHSFCTHTILQNDILEVPDATIDDKF